MKIYIWEQTEGSVYDDTPAVVTLYTNEADVLKDIRETLNERRDDEVDHGLGDVTPLIPDDLDAGALIKWACEQDAFEDEAQCWCVHTWDTDKNSRVCITSRVCTADY